MDSRTRRYRSAPAMTAGLTLGVAGPGADDAFLAAEFVTFAGRVVERARNLRADRIAVRAAGIGHVDRKGGTGALHNDGRALALAMLQRFGARFAFGRIVIGLAVSSAFAHRKRAGRKGRRETQQRQE